jgi:4-carboxymuconolactone decarboxylase
MSGDTRKQLFEEGQAIRRAVLGPEYVDNSMKIADDFSRPMQELTTEYCWGAVWSRPGLNLKTRSLLNLAMLTALNRPNELELHLHGALNNGVTEDEIREVFMQAAIYCGVPAAMVSFKIAGKVLAEQGTSGEANDPDA